MEICKSDVYFIIVMLFIFYIFYELKNLKKEKFEVTDNVKQAINQFYNADVDAIRNLSNIATKLQAGTLTSPGNLTVAGELYVNNWLRVRGNNGIYFEDRGGGWNMTDNDWIRSFGGKNVYCDKELRAAYVRSDGDLQVNGTINANTVKANTFCIGNTCINEDHLKMLTGNKDVGFEAPSGFMHVQGGTGKLVFWGGPGSAAPFKLKIL